MAITLISAPQRVSPVYNPIAFTVSSDNTTECNFTYICDVYVNGIYVTRLKLFPSGANDYATFFVERILEDFLTYDLQENLYGSSIFAMSPNSIIDYELRFGEEYDSSAQCDAGTDIYPDLLITQSCGVATILNPAFGGSSANWILAGDVQYFDEAIEFLGPSFGSLTQENVFSGFISQCLTFGFSAVSGTIDIRFGTNLVAQITSPGSYTVCGVPTGNLNLVVSVTSSSIGILEAVYPSSSDTCEYEAFNGALQHAEWLSFNYADHLATDSTSRFLTTMPDNVMIKQCDEMVYNIFVEQFGVDALGAYKLDVDFLEVKTYTKSGSLIGTYTFSNAVTTDHIGILSVGVGPHNLNNSTLTSGSQPVIDATVHHYTVQLTSLGSPMAMSELRTIQLDNRETKYDNNRVFWLNRFGVFDAYTFSLRSDRDIRIDRNGFTHVYGHQTSNNPWTYNISDRGKTTLNVNASETTKHVSNWLTENEGLWLETLFTSPEVYIGDSYGQCVDCISSHLTPVIVSSTSFEEKLKRNVRNINYTITLNKSHDINIQRN
jgi:hypothetical protein